MLSFRWYALSPPQTTLRFLLHMSENPGLRRRSPKPNSPIPYSPALLSPYINLTPQLGLGYHDPLARYHQSSPNPNPKPEPDPDQDPPTPNPHPTIRLVPSSGGPSSPMHPNRYSAPSPERSKSDDTHLRASTISSSVASFRRHGTDPKSYR